MNAITPPNDVPLALTQNWRPPSSETEEEPLSEKALSQALQEHGFERVRGKDKHRTRGWKGLRIPDVFDQAASDGSDGL